MIKCILNGEVIYKSGSHSPYVPNTNDFIKIDGAYYAVDQRMYEPETDTWTIALEEASKNILARGL